MLTHTSTASAPRRALPSVPVRPPEPGATLLKALGSIEDEDHTLVLGRIGPDLMCALLQAGAPQVTQLRSYIRLGTASASLVIVLQVHSLEWLESALSPIRRALIVHGRLVVCIDPPPNTDSRVRRMLTLHGFTTMRASRAAGRLMLSTEVPAFGLLRCA